jgi:heme exporter protein D
MSVKKAFRVWMAVCTSLVTLGILAVVGYTAYHYLLQPAADALPVGEQCLQSGGTWNADDNMCVHAS